MFPCGASERSQRSVAISCVGLGEPPGRLNRSKSLLEPPWDGFPARESLLEPPWDGFATRESMLEPHLDG